MSALVVSGGELPAGSAGGYLRVSAAQALEGGTVSANQVKTLGQVLARVADQDVYRKRLRGYERV